MLDSRNRLVRLVALVLFAAVLNGCGGSPSRITAEPAAVSQTTTTTETTMAPTTSTTYPAARALVAVDALMGASARYAIAAAVRRPARVNAWPQGQQGQPVQPRPPAAATSSCDALLQRYFADDLDWARRVAARESGCTAGAVNNEGCDTSGRTNSHALGVFQMCYPLHQAAFDAAGCNQPLDADCNIRAARVLYNAAGRGPWGG